MNAIEIYENAIRMFELNGEITPGEFEDMIKPLEDVAPVVHGKWIKTTVAEPCGTDELHKTIYRDRETVKCSECGNPSPIYNIEFEFCPRCGARMDGTEALKGAIK